MPPASHCTGRIRIQRLYHAQMKSSPWRILRTGLINADHSIFYRVPPDQRKTFFSRIFCLSLYEFEGAVANSFL
ncbi:hypothetical protein Y032_0375g221 [Ancylostoma ceylanicum]|uniref:Uncharacterized protein n=1 Tax=Ancylostoma ceylanicum TaxID=53326 RepID=A0A016RTI8_9BILA|nr:hypothetical protein Y032_0375g221 [Ancylostoma ceylanicum]